MADTARGAAFRSTSTVLVGCSLAAWVVTIWYAADMPAAPGTMGLGVLGFLALWTVMMGAMMLPSVLPVVSLYVHRLRSEPSRRVRTLRTAGLVTGYLTTWGAFGLVAFGLARAGDELARRSPDVAPWVGASALVAAGIYQLTPAKDFCLGHCRSPVSFLLHYGNVKGRARDFQVGMRHGAFCVGCCWGLMVVLLVVGIMSLTWMAAIAGVVLLEKMWRHGVALSKALGLAIIAFALLVPAHPALLAGLHQTMPM